MNTPLSQQESEVLLVNSQRYTSIPFEISADNYDENRHFFLGYHFRDTYNEALSRLPYVQSPVRIERIEVWVTNRRGVYDQSRDIVAFADLGERRVIHNPLWEASGSSTWPANRANTLYDQLVTRYAGARELSESDQLLPGGMVAGNDYEKLGNARLLDPSEYTLQRQLGYVTLRLPLQPDEVLAVAYEYTVDGQAYQVGEFARDVEQIRRLREAAETGLLLPASSTWDLMMKNILPLGPNAYQVERDRCLDISYRSDSTGTGLTTCRELRHDRRWWRKRWAGGR